MCMCVIGVRLGKTLHVLEHQARLRSRAQVRTYLWPTTRFEKLIEFSA